MFGAYQSLVHVPLIIRDPLNRLAAGVRSQTCVSTRRLFHTILDVANVAQSNEASLSLLSVLSENAPEPERVFAEAIPPQWVLERLWQQYPDLVPEPGFNWMVRAMYQNDYKLLVENDNAELYALREDPYELQDVSARFPAQVSQMQTAMRRFESEVQPAGEATEHALGATVEARLQDLGYL
jgi:arylsulfatase A-like enzyme